MPGDNGQSGQKVRDDSSVQYSRNVCVCVCVPPQGEAQPSVSSADHLNAVRSTLFLFPLAHGD